MKRNWIVAALFCAALVASNLPAHADMLSFVAANSADNKARAALEEVRALREDVAALSAKLDKLNVCRQARP